MQTKMPEKNNCNSSTKQYLLKMAASKIIKAYFFLIFNEYFSLRNGVFCSESSDDSFIEKTLENSNSTEKLGEVSNNNRENLNVIGQIQDDFKEQTEKSENFQSVDSSPSTTESEKLQKTVDHYYTVIRSTLMRLEIFPTMTVPILKKKLKEMQTQLEILKENIIKEKNNVNTDNLSFNDKKLATEKLCILEKIEQFYKEKNFFCQSAIFKIDFKKFEALEMSKQLTFFIFKINNVKKSKSHCDTADLIKRIDTSKGIEATTFFFNGIDGFEQSLKDQKTQIESILSVFSKLNNLTLEELEVVNNLIIELNL